MRQANDLTQAFAAETQATQMMIETASPVRLADEPNDLEIDMDRRTASIPHPSSQPLNLMMWKAWEEVRDLKLIYQLEVWKPKATCVGRAVTDQIPALPP